MNRSQGSRNPGKQQTPRAKNKVVHTDEALRQAEVSWNKQAKKVQGLNILDRCKRLNEFLSKGLLGEIELDEDGLGSFDLQAATQHHSPAVGQNSKQGAPTVIAHPKPRPEAPIPAVPSRQPLTSRITALETSALLDLLIGEADGSSNPVIEDAQQHAVVHIDTTAVAAAAPPLQSQACILDSNASGKQQQQHYRGMLHAPAVTGTAATAAKEAFELVGLLNADNTNCLATVQPVLQGIDSSSKSGLAATADFRQILKHQRAAITIQRHLRGTMVRRHILPKLKQHLANQAIVQQVAAACLQRTFRCKQAQKIVAGLRQQRQQAKQQHQELCQQRPGALRSSDKQSSINAAWQGYYETHGQHAACVIQQCWRAHNARRLHQQQQAATVVLQAVCRGWLVRRRTVAELRLRMKEWQRMLLHTQTLNQQWVQRKEAALVLQSCARGWCVRRMLQLLKQQHQAIQTAAEANTAAAFPAGIQPMAECAVYWLAEPLVHPTNHGKCCNAELDAEVGSTACGSNSSSSTGDEHSISTPRQISSRGSRSSRCSTAQQDCRRVNTNSIRQHQQQSECKASLSDVCRASCSCGSGRHATKHSNDGSATSAQGTALTGRQLLIRSAADMRTATQHGDGSSAVGVGCSEQLAKELLWRAEELQVAEGQQQVDLSVRATIASSSFRKLQEAMVAVKSRHTAS